MGQDVFLFMPSTFIYMRVQVASLSVSVSGAKIERVCTSNFSVTVQEFYKNKLIYILCTFMSPHKNENGNIKFPFVTFILVSQIKVTCHGCYVINFISLP